MLGYSVWAVSWRGDGLGREFTTLHSSHLGPHEKKKNAEKRLAAFHPFKCDLKEGSCWVTGAGRLSPPYIGAPVKCLRRMSATYTSKLESIQTFSVNPPKAGLIGPRTPTSAIFSSQLASRAPIIPDKTKGLPLQNLSFGVGWGCGGVS